MAFENVNSHSLKQSLQSCKNTLKKSQVQSLLDDVTSENGWICDSKKELVQALNKLVNTRYNERENRLNEYISAANKIDEYQELEQENRTLSSRLTSLNSKLYYIEYYKEKQEVNGEEVYVTNSRWQKDINVQNQMSQIEEKINQNKKQMNNLKAQITNKI